LITLTTDIDQFYVAQVKGSILSINPDSRIFDLSHEVGRFAIRRASFVVMCGVRMFPRGTVHVCVVDPGVGGQRRAIVVDSEYGYLVGPDNGVFTLPVSLFEGYDAYSIDAPWARGISGRDISPTFHGRDIFAPVAAFLDSGGSPEECGTRVEWIETFELQEPRGTDSGAAGTVLYVDGFGNVVTNIPEGTLEAEAGKDLWARVGGKTFPCQSASCYSEAEQGKLILLVGSQGTYELGVNLGSASSLTGASEGDAVELVEVRE
jgi:hypothetical protein